MKHISTVIAVLLASTLMLVTAFSLPATAATASQNDKITTELGPTDELGGGDHFYVKFGSDAAFGIVWGNESNHNNVYLVSYISRQLGYINVNEPNGTVLTQKPVKIYTLYAVKLNGLIEYNDTNGNGVLNFAPLDSGQLVGLYGLGHEQIYKGVDLSTAWTMSNFQNGTDSNGNLTWTFSLTATNLSYKYNTMHNATSDKSGDNLLNSIVLTFHLTASSKSVADITMPQWEVTMKTGPFGGIRFQDLQRTSNLTVSGNVTDYHVKWDKNISGWDFDPKDQNATLMVDYHALVENYIPASVTGLMALAEYQRIIQTAGENGTMTADNQDLDGSSAMRNAFALHTPRLTFGGERSRIGTFEWVQNVTVDGVQKSSHSQVTAMFPFNVYFRGKDFYGFIAAVGISYPAGNNIVQDPSIESQAVTDVALSSGSGSPTGTSHLYAPIVGIALIAAAAIAITAFAVRARNKTGKIEYEQKGEQPKDDWEKYYEKK